VVPGETGEIRSIEGIPGSAEKIWNCIKTRVNDLRNGATGCQKVVNRHMETKSLCHRKKIESRRQTGTVEEGDGTLPLEFCRSEAGEGNTSPEIRRWTVALVCGAHTRI